MSFLPEAYMFYYVLYKRLQGAVLDYDVHSETFTDNELIIDLVHESREIN